MRKLYAVLFLVFAGWGASAQQYGNEWINYSQKYYAIKIIQDGIYRLDSATLANAGIDLSVVSPQNLQVFGRQQQQAIYIQGEADGVFNSGDYLEFLAFKNDGSIDSLVYQGGERNMPDTYYSLYNDTATYYLTYNALTTNLRAQPFNDTTFSSYALTPYYTATAFTKYSDEYYMGPLLEGASESRFVPGEGWVGYKIQGIGAPGGATFNSMVQTPLVYTGAGAPPARISTSAMSNSNAALTVPGALVNHHLRIRYGPGATVLLDTSFLGYKLLRQFTDVPASTLTMPATTVMYEVPGDIPVGSDIFNVASSTITYPHRPDFGGLSNAEFKVDFNALQPYSNFSIANYGGASPLVYMAGSTVYRTTGRLTGSTLQLLVPNDVSTNAVKCHVFNTTLPVTQLKPVNGTGTFTDFGSIMADSAFLIVTHASLNTGAQAYAGYRGSMAGGSYATVVAHIDELYDQFSAGVYKHSLAVRRFCDYLIHTWPSKPKFLFVIGKSVREASEGNGASLTGARKDPAKYAESLVPSFGYPSSDNRITAGLDGTNMEPAIPTGRISATSNAQVDDYLQKMVEYEQAQQFNVYTKPEKDWMKHALAFGGGSTFLEQQDFKGYLLNYKRRLEDSLFAGTVDTFFKSSSDPIDPVDFQTVNQRINDGVSMMIFFGHGSIGGFDQNVDDINNWQNQGKYPFLVGNSCYSGDIHQSGALSVSEQFTLIPDKGVIGFLSTVKQGFVFDLNRYSDSLMREISQRAYGLSVGEQIQRTVRALQDDITAIDNINSIPPEEVYTGMTLHGDPALRINPHALPELVIEPSDVYINPANVTLANDSMDVVVNITNLGRGTAKPFIVSVTRSFPNANGDSTYIKVVNGMNYKQTVVFRIPVYHSIAFGLNAFEVTVDLESPSVPEQYDEVNNNRVGFTFSISGNSILPVYPYDYAIVPDSITEVKASTVNPLAPPHAYRFELDTTDLFNSPFKRYLVITSPGGVVSVPHTAWLSQITGALSPLVHADSAVYFWRVSPDSSTFVWQESSYQYIKGQTGWGQSHFFQFKNNAHTHLGYNRTARNWEFETINEIISANVYGFITTITESLNTAWFTNGQLQEYDGVGFQPTIYVAVNDPYDPEPWSTFKGDFCTDPAGVTNIRYYGQFNCRPVLGPPGRCRGEEYFGFLQNSAVQLDSLYSMITSKIPCGHHYIIYSYNYANFNFWDANNPNLYTMFANLGAEGMTPGMANRPFILMGRMCDTASTKIVFGDTLHTGNLLTLSDTLTGILPGIMQSVKIGPAQEWNALYWKQHPMEAITGDSTLLSLYGIRPSGVEVKLFDTTFTRYDSILNLNGLVDAVQYPQLRLRALTVDNATQTPAHFDRWQLLYQPVPEAALSPQDGYFLSLSVDTLQEGDEFRFAMAIKNISNMDMDSLLVHYWVEDQNRVKHYITYSRQDSLRAGQVLYDTVSVPTLNFAGANYLWIEANPVPLLSATTQYDQPEQHHFNNIARIPFAVSEDNENPILDVTFDGRHILNGDIVSAKPFILMSLDDENQFLLMDQPSDTSRFLVYLADPSGNEKRVYFNQGGVEQLKFIPAEGSANKCKIEWSAKFNADGVYTLRARAWDKNDNRSGNKDYRIKFEVIQRQTITHVMNYPNPFSTRTQFVFTLTGSELPQYMKIQIFTVTGRVVREITMDELGPIYIGKNITSYAWDGRDEFGDQLANGVYFYRVISKDNGLNAIEKRETGADQYFKKEFGKMYLMR